MNWILEHLQLLLGVAAAIAYFLNRRRQQPDGDDAEEPTHARGQVSDEQAERTRRVQEEIRRKIAERRGSAAQTPERQVKREVIPPIMKPTHVPPLDPFGGPMRRIIKKIEEAAGQRMSEIESSEAATRAAELVRQNRLAEQIRELEIARAAQERRAAEIAAAKKNQRTKPRTVPAIPSNLRAMLRDPQELRRAVVSREILGPPVGLR